MLRRVLLAVVIALSLGLLAPPAMAQSDGGVFDDTQYLGVPEQSSDNSGDGGGDSSSQITSVNPLVYVGEQAQAVPGIVQEVNNTVPGENEVLTWNEEGNTVAFQVDYYSTMSYTERRDIMENMLKTVSQSSLNNKQKNKLYNFIADQDSEISRPIRMLETNTNADTVRAGALVKPFFAVFNIILGLLVLLLMMGIVFSTVLDMMYITIPALQSSNSQNGRFTASAKRFVSSTARVAVDESNDQGKSGLGFYFKHRALTLIMAMFVILLVVTGRVWDVVLLIADSLMVLLPS